MLQLEFFYRIAALFIVASLSTSFKNASPFGGNRKEGGRRGGGRGGSREKGGGGRRQEGGGRRKEGEGRREKGGWRREDGEHFLSSGYPVERTPSGYRHFARTSSGALGPREQKNKKQQKAI